MSGLSPIHWRKFEKFLLLTGCAFVRQKGDHRIYWKSGLSRPIVIPKDSNIPVFILRNNLRLLDIDPQQFLEMLHQI